MAPAQLERCFMWALETLDKHARIGAWRKADHPPSRSRSAVWNAMTRRIHALRGCSVSPLTTAEVIVHSQNTWTPAARSQIKRLAVQHRVQHLLQHRRHPIPPLPRLPRHHRSVDTRRAMTKQLPAVRGSFACLPQTDRDTVRFLSTATRATRILLRQPAALNQHQHPRQRLHRHLRQRLHRRRQTRPLPPSRQPQQALPCRLAVGVHVVIKSHAEIAWCVYKHQTAGFARCKTTRTPALKRERIKHAARNLPQLQCQRIPHIQHTRRSRRPRPRL